MSNDVDNQIRERLAAGVPVCRIARELRVGGVRIRAIRDAGSFPEPRRTRREDTEGEGEGEHQAEPAVDDGALDDGTVTVAADYLHALEAVVILTHMLAAAREA